MAAYLVYDVVQGFDLIGSERVQGIFKSKDIANQYAKKCGYFVRGIADDADKKLIME